MFQEDISLVHKIAREVAKEEIALAAAAITKVPAAVEVKAPEIIDTAPAQEVPADEESASHKRVRR